MKEYEYTYTHLPSKATLQDMQHEKCFFNILASIFDELIDMHTPPIVNVFSSFY
jgi:hypothetical protein